MKKQLTTVSASSAKTTSGTSTATDVEGTSVSVLLDVTAASGTTPSLTVSLEWSHDGSTWFTGDPADSMTAVTAAGKRVKSFTTKAPYVRAAWAITGTTPSFTFAAHIFSMG